MLEILHTFGDFVAIKLGLDISSRLGSSVSFFVEDTIKIFLLIYVMLFVVSLFRAQLSPEKIKNYLSGKSAWIGYMLAVFLGVVTPFCSCSSIPLFIAFIAAGIPFGITMTFLISSPLISEIAAALLLITPKAGIVAAVLYVFVGAIISILGGWLCDKYGLERLKTNQKYNENPHKNNHCHHDIHCTCHFKNGIHDKSCPCYELILENNCECSQNHNHHHLNNEEHCNCSHHHEHKENDSLIKYAYNYTNSTIKEIWLFVLLGLGVGAIMHGYIPTEMYAKYLGANNPFAVVIAAFAGIPIYANHDSVLPIIQVLLLKGVPLGTTLVMLMSITAISLPEMIMLHKVLSGKMLAIFVSYLFISFIIVGYILNLILL
jgi:uncharacterized membrane protein YraQ (UPF0718 family)